MNKSKLLKINQILKKYPVLFAYLFGSQTSKKSGPMSDINIAVYFDGMTPKEKYDNLRYTLQEKIALALKMPEKIDVVPLNDAQPLLEREVVYDGKIIYCQNEGKRAHYESTAIGRWLDWKWYNDQYNQAIEKNFGKPITKCKVYG